jgi:hypothetical protein
MAIETHTETAAEYLSERRDFLHVGVAPSASGEGWDVVLRLDGTYSDRATAEAAVDDTRWRLEHLGDVSTEGRIWWDGPPFESDPTREPNLRVVD